MERRSFIGTIISAAGAIVAGGLTQLTVPKQDGMVVGVVVFRVHLEDGKQFVFRRIVSVYSDPNLARQYVDAANA